MIGKRISLWYYVRSIRTFVMRERMEKRMNSIYNSLNKPQREAVLHTEGPLLILAGAGS